MKTVFGVSLGSSRRDHEVVVSFLGEPVRLIRRGTDGDLAAAVRLVEEHDGRVDAIGLGGLDVFLVVAGRRYVIQDALRLVEAARQTPVVDGSGIKNTLERDVVFQLADDGLLRKGTKVLMVSALDRFGMAEALVEVGCDVIFGDLIFTAGIPYPIPTLQELAEVASRVLPEMVKMPLSMLYPTGRAQEEIRRDEKYAQYYRTAEVIAGDWHLIHKYLPERLDNKIILTNTTTSDDVRLLQEIGVRCLITTTPVLSGRSFGTNILEALVVAVSGCRPEELADDGYRAWLRRLDLRPAVRWLAEEG